MEFTINDRPGAFQGAQDLSVLTWLREVEGLLSPKDGCSGEGVCGSCTVLLDGVAKMSCRLSMSDLAGKRLTTLEGLPDRQRTTFADAFAVRGGTQCGFCTPGIVMRASALLAKRPDATEREIRNALTPHLCRCTGYVKVIDAVSCAAQALRTERPVDRPAGTGGVGSRHPKLDAPEAVLGERPFVADLVEPGMLHGALRFSDHPRARVRSVDVTPALAVDGVVSVLTAADVPGERRVGLILQDWPVLVAEGEETRYVGDVVAAVAARTEDTARAAAALVRVEYDVLPAVTTPEEALAQGSPRLDPGGNVLSVTEIRVGQAEEALAASAYVVREHFTTQRIEHAFMEPEATLATPWPVGDELGVRVLDCGQGVYEDRRQLAGLLGLPERLVDVVQVQNGGGFGGKEDLTTQGHAALLAWHTGAPVRVRLTREESMRMHPKRHPFELDYALGCDADGKLTALVATLVADSGAYASVGMKVVERAVCHSTGAYTVPNVHVTGTAVITNNVPCGAMRGFGVNQSNFAMESCVDELCRRGGFDRWRFRWDNALREGRTTATGQVLHGGVGVRACLEALEPRFRAAEHAGLAAGLKNTGIGCGVPDVGRASVAVEAPDRVVVRHGWCEMGQGLYTMAVQTLVEETGIDPAYVVVEVDTADELVTGMTTASRGTSLVGHAVRAAAAGLRAELDAGRQLSDLVGRSYAGEWVCDWTTPVGAEPQPGQEIVTHYSYGYAAQLVELDATGRITRITAAHDAGRVINPTLFEGQIEGALHMGLGYALTEEFPMEDGWPVSTRMAALGILRTRDMPPIDVIPVEVPDPNGPFGAKGVGEIGLVPTAPAVANALAALDGTRHTALPMRDPRPLRRRP